MSDNLNIHFHFQSDLVMEATPFSLFRESNPPGLGTWKVVYAPAHMVWPQRRASEYDPSGRPAPN